MISSDAASLPKPHEVRKILLVASCSNDVASNFQGAGDATLEIEGIGM